MLNQEHYLAKCSKCLTWQNHSVPGPTLFNLTWMKIRLWGTDTQSVQSVNDIGIVHPKTKIIRTMTEW